ncbi:MAG: hypothetical protein QM619_09060 [Micropruina sp.]|uniref:hypothetical protein n=1 Tax=Micropruina sp. TaxID=2737536 RepID=UPI0039E37970
MSLLYLIAAIPVILPGVLRLFNVGLSVKRGGHTAVKAGFCQVLPWFCFRSR